MGVGFVTVDHAFMARRKGCKSIDSGRETLEVGGQPVRTEEPTVKSELLRSGDQLDT